MTDFEPTSAADDVWSEDAEGGASLAPDVLLQIVLPVTLILEFVILMLTAQYHQMAAKKPPPDAVQNVENLIELQRQRLIASWEKSRRVHEETIGMFPYLHKKPVHSQDGKLDDEEFKKACQDSFEYLDRAREKDVADALMAALLRESGLTDTDPRNCPSQSSFSSEGAAVLDATERVTCINRKYALETLITASLAAWRDEVAQFEDGWIKNLYNERDLKEAAAEAKEKEKKRKEEDQTLFGILRNLMSDRPPVEEVQDLMANARGKLRDRLEADGYRFLPEAWTRPAVPARGR